MKNGPPAKLPGNTTVTVLLLATALVLASTAAGFLVLYDDHAAHLGVAAVDGSEFRYEDPPVEVYSKAYRFSAGEGRRVLESTRYSNGTRVVEERTLEGSGERRPEGPLGRVSFTSGGVRYERRTYEERYAPEVLGPHVYHDEETNSVYEIEKVERDADESGYELRQAFTRYSYVENGSGEWRGRGYSRYDLLDPRSTLERLTDEGEPRGYILVDEADRVRYGELGEEGERELVYETYVEPRHPVPFWVSWIDSTLEVEPPVPDLSAYHLDSDVVVVVSESRWTPRENLTVALTYRYGGAEPKTGPVAAGEPVLRRHGEDAYVAYLSTDGENLELTHARPRVDVDTGSYVTTPDSSTLIFDRNGLNLLETSVSPSSSLGGVYSVTAAHLKPENGGGRVLRVDGLELGDRFDGDTEVTIKVSNSTSSRSITKEAGELSSDRFYLLRTPEGLETVNSGGIAVHVSPSTSFSGRRFVSNATLRIAADDVPFYRTSLPTRVTRASEVPIERLLTGVGVQLYETPPERRAMLGQGRVIRSMNWSDHVLLKVHSWDYDYLHVEGGEVIGIFRPVLYEDETRYYRLEQGERYSVETEDGRVLVEGTANGSEVVSP